MKIFMEDSIESTMEKKIRKFTKVKEIEKEVDEYTLKVRDSYDMYRELEMKSANNLK